MRITTMLALLVLVAAAHAGPSLLPSEKTLTALLHADTALADEVAAVATGLGYVPTLMAFTRVQAFRAFKAGHLIEAAQWRLVHARLARGKPVDVEAPSSVPFPAGEKVNFELLAEVPIIGNTRVGKASTTVLPAVLSDGKVSLRLSAQVIVERFSPQKSVQEIWADPESLLVTRSDVTRYDDKGNVTDKYTDTFDHPKHQTVRTRATGAPVITSYSASHTISSAAWVPYSARAQGFDVGTAWDLVLIEDGVGFKLNVASRTNIGADRVFSLQSNPSRVSAWLFDNARRLPRRVVMTVDMATRDNGGDPGFFTNRKVTLEYKSVEGVAEDIAD